MLDGGGWGWAVTSAMFLTLCVLQYPGVILDLIECVALFRVESENVLDEVSHLGCQVLWELQVYGLDPLVRLVIVACLKWRETTAKLKTEDSETPNIYTLVVRLLNHHLRGQVVQCPAESLPAIVRGVDAPTEICDFDCTL